MISLPQQLNPLASQVAAAAAMGSIAGSQVFGNTLSNLQGATGQLVTNAQGQVSQTYSGECWIFLAHMPLIKYRQDNIFWTKHSSIQSIKHYRLITSSDQCFFVDTPSYIELLGE